MAESCDVVIGVGHNGLVCAFYLASAGYRVKVFEQRSVVGGAAVTEEFHPGFRNSVASYTVSLLNPKVIRDLDLARHRLKIVERQLSNFFPLPDNQYLKTGEGVTHSEFARFSQRDAECYDRYAREIDAVADVRRDMILRQPPNLVEGGWRSALSQGWRALLDLFTRSAGDYLDGWFETDCIKAAFGFDSIVGNFASPYTSNTA